MKKTHLLLVLVLSLVLLESCKSRQKKKSEYMQNFYTDVKDLLPEAEIQIVEDSIKVIFSGATFFEVGETDLMPETYPLFKRFASVLEKYNNTHVLVLGHTDSGGDEQKNLELSNKRALSAKNQLIKEGVNEGRLSSWGMGETAPVYDNNTEEGRAKNRRIEFIILYGEKEE